jgi:hypothetical protein
MTTSTAGRCFRSEANQIMTTSNSGSMLQAAATVAMRGQYR